MRTHYARTILLCENSFVACRRYAATMTYNEHYGNNTPKYKRGRHSIDTACVVTLQAYSTSELKTQIKLYTQTYIKA